MIAPPRLPIVLVAAVARNGVIGRDGAMPWHLPGDMQHFKAITAGRPVVMGRRTFETIGHALPGRPTFVVSRDPDFSRPGIVVAASIEALMAGATEAGAASGADAIMVAGGGTLYRALLGLARRLELTEVEADPVGDTTFPALDPRDWIERHRRTPAPLAGDSARYSFVTLERRTTI